MASSKIKGITIEIDGNTSKLNDALRGTEQELNKTQKELKNVNSALKFDPKNTELLAQKQKLLGSAIKDTSEKLKTLKKAQEEARAKGLDEDSEDYRELVREISRTEASLKGLKSQQEDVNDALKDGGEKASTFLDVLKANLTSDLIVGGLKAIGSAIKGVATSVKDLIVDGANYADEVNTLAKQYNLSTKEIQQYQKASQLIDVEFSTIAKSLSKLTKQMTSTSKETTKAFKTLGVSVKDNKGNLRDSNQVFNEVIQKLSEVKNETEQDALALQIFGKSSAELGSLINGGAEQLAEFNKFLEENNLILSQDELDTLNNVQDSFDEFNATIDGIKKKLAVELAPVIQPLLEDIQKYILDHKDDIVQFVQEVVDYLTGDEGKQMFNDIGQMVKDIGDFLLDLPQLREEIKLLATPLKVVASILGTIVDAIKFLKENNGNFNIPNREGIPTGIFSNGSMNYGLHSGGFGALQSGGYGNTITLNASFVANGNLNEAQALRFADLMTARINENLGRGI